MANKKVTYKEPAGYFTPSMRKVAAEWDKANAAKKKTAEPKKTADAKKKTAEPKKTTKK